MNQYPPEDDLGRQIFRDIHVVFQFDLFIFVAF